MLNENFLILRASGGLANRIQAILGGIAHCLLSGRTLCVDWRDGMYSTDFSNVFPLWFELQGVSHAPVEHALNAFNNGASLAPVFWEQFIAEPIAVEYLFDDNAHMSSAGRLQSSYPLSPILTEPAPQILVHWGYDLTTLNLLAQALGAKYARFAHKNVNEIANILLNEYLVPRKEILDAVRSFYTEHFPKKPMGIHIRHSDLQSPLPQTLEKLKELYHDGDAIFLCTDNALVEKMVQRIYPACVVRKKSFQDANIPLHSYTENIDNVQKGFDALVEMYLLAECKNIIHYAPSSFARIAILRANLQTENVHCIPEVTT